MEQFVLQRIQLLYNQISSSLNRKEYLRLISKITKLSKRWGVTVRPDCLDIRFVNDKLVSHPLVRYLNLRNNIIFDKVKYFNEQIQSGLFSTEEILKLSSYSTEEFIPSMTLDTFYTQSLNGLKYRIKNSIQLRGFKSLIKLIN